MSAQLKLASQLQQTAQKLGAELAAKKRARIETNRQAQQEEIDGQIKAAPFIAKMLIKGLPEFLERCSNAEYSSAYVVYRLGCKPYEHFFPNYVSKNRHSQYNDSDMTEYAVRRYMKGTIQHVALWGLKQGFHVGLGHISDYRDFEFEQKRHQGISNVYMPGMFRNYIPTGVNTDLLFFAW